MVQVSSVRITPAKITQILEAGRMQLSSDEFEELARLLFDLEVYGFTPWINVRLGTLMAKIEWQLEVGPSPEWEEALIACDRAFLGRELRDMCDEAGVSPIGHKKLLCAKLYRAGVPEVVEVMEPYLEEKEAPEQVTKTEPTGDDTELIYLLAAVSGDPVRKFCCRQCSECAPPELLGEGKFPERIAWLRHHYKVKHPGLWGRRLPQVEPLYAEKVRRVKDRLEDLHRTDPDEFYRRRKIIEQAIKEREKGQMRTMVELTLEELRDVLKFTTRLYR